MIIGKLIIGELIIGDRCMTGGVAGSAIDGDETGLASCGRTGDSAVGEPIAVVGSEGGAIDGLEAMALR